MEWEEKGWKGRREKSREREREEGKLPGYYNKCVHHYLPAEGLMIYYLTFDKIMLCYINTDRVH